MVPRNFRDKEKETRKTKEENFTSEIKVRKKSFLLHKRFFQCFRKCIRLDFKFSSKQKNQFLN